MLNSKERERLLYPDQDRSKKLTHFQARKKLAKWYEGIQDAMLILVSHPKKENVGTIVTDEVLIHLLDLASTHLEVYPVQTLRNRPPSFEKPSETEIRKQEAFFNSVKRLISALPIDSELEHEIRNTMKNKGRY